ncbi:MAG: hypothetical protein ACU83V_12300, partial [Gammaproteobacteria bacterium]
MQTLAIIGLGYVGLPLAIEFGKKYKTIGFDINQTRIDQLKKGIDSTLEVDEIGLKQATLLSFSSHIEDIAKADVYIVTVPTPIDEHKQPVLTPLIEASTTIGSMLKPNDVVIYEST